MAVAVSWGDMEGIWRTKWWLTRAAVERPGGNCANGLVLDANCDMDEIPMLNETEQAILQTLVKLDETVKSMATANPKPNLLPLFARLDELATQLPPDADPELQHFLKRK